MADPIVEATADAATAKVEATGAVVAAAEAKDEAAEALAAAAATAEAARIAEGAAAAAVAIAEDTATRDAGKRIAEFEGALSQCRTELESLKGLVTELQASNASALATLTQLGWLTELEQMTDEKTSDKSPTTKETDTSAADSGGAPTAASSAKPKAESGADPAAAPLPKPEAEHKPAPGGKKHNWL